MDDLLDSYDLLIAECKKIQADFDRMIAETDLVLGSDYKPSTRPEVRVTLSDR